MLTAVLAGMAVALFAPALDRGTNRAAGWVCAAVPAALFVYFMSLAPAVTRGQDVISVTPWAPSLGLMLSFHLDGLALLFALLITGIGTIVFVYTGAYLAGDPRRGRLFAFLAFFMSAMLGTVLADNVLALFVFWELTSISSYLLIGFDHERAAARAAALQALLVTGLGGLTMLAGLLLLARAGGTYELSELIGRSGAIVIDPRYEISLCLILLGAFTKSAQWPFSFWLPDAMEAPSPVSAYLHSSTMVKAGVYLVARLAPILGGTAIWTGVVSTVGLLTMIVAAVLAARQTDLKRILAYSTVSALGTMIWLLGTGTVLSATAAISFLLGHAFYKAALFLAAGTVAHETGERDVGRLGGLRSAMPMTATAAMLAGLSMAGFPPMLGFIGKELAFDAAFHTPVFLPVVASVALVTMTFLVALGLLAGFGPFSGTRPKTLSRAHDGPPEFWLGALLLSAYGLLAGLMPSAVGWILRPAVASVTGATVQLDLGLWHGFTPALLFSALALVGGISLYRRSRRRRQSMVGATVPESLAGGGLYIRAFGALNWVAKSQTRLLQSGYLRFYLATIVSTTVALTLYMLRRHPWPSLGALSRPINWLEVALATLILVAAGSAVGTKHRLAAVTMLGVVGYGVALMFAMNGAPDLAMTQFVIEALTVVLFVIVVYRLPRINVESVPATRVRDATIALSAGALMATLVWVATRVQLQPSIATFFTERSVTEAHGRNVVNVILVDFRALDTLGEIAVLALAGVGVHALVKLRLADLESKPTEEDDA